MTKKIKRIISLILILILAFFIVNGIIIYKYSSEYSEEKSDVAIVLGAGTNDGEISPIFKERINHSVYLFNKKRVKNIIVTGGFGKDQQQSDSEIGRAYLLSQGIPEEVVLIEGKSRYTIENLIESKQIMDSLNFNSALLVTDPLHMKRSIELANKLNIKCSPSPTKTTMYRTFVPKVKSLGL